MGRGARVTDLPTDIRQVSVNRVTLGVILSSALLASSISWSASRLVSRLDAVEATVEAIQESMDMRSFARVEDVSEDVEDIWAEIDDLSDEIEGVKDSVGFLLMGDEQSHWEGG